MALIDYPLAERVPSIPTLPVWALEAIPAELLTPERKKALKDEKRRVIPLVRYVAAGQGIVAEEGIEEYALIDLNWARSSLMAVRVRGASMAPVIPNNAIIGVDLNDRQVISGKVYVIRTQEGEYAVKQLVKDRRAVLCRSLNPSLGSPPFPLHAEEGGILPVVGRVVWVWQAPS